MAQRDYSSSQDDYRQGASGGPRSAAGGNYGDTRPSEHSQPYGEQSGDYPPGGGMRHQEARNFGGGQQGGGYRDSEGFGPQRTPFGNTQGGYPVGQPGGYAGGRYQGDDGGWSNFASHGNYGHPQGGFGPTPYRDTGAQAQGGYPGYQGTGPQSGYPHLHGQVQGNGHQEPFDPEYHQWRQEQMQNLDNDYHSWRGERYKKFADEFSTWRNNRNNPDSGVTRSAGAASQYGSSSSQDQAAGSGSTPSGKSK